MKFRQAGMILASVIVVCGWIQTIYSTLRYCYRTPVVTTPARRSAFSLMIATLNTPHILLWCDGQQLNSTPFLKLRQKLQAYLRGELKSESNLLRFFDAFCEWKDSQPEEDSLNYRIAQLTMAALYSATETLFDPECDDMELLTGSVAELYDEMDALGGETTALRDYWQSLSSELDSLLSDNASRPLPAAYFRWLSEADVSLFGLAE